VRRIAIAVVVAAAVLFQGLGGTAAANGGTGTAIACSGTAKNVIREQFLISVEEGSVAPSQRRLATCAYAEKVAHKVTWNRLEAPAAVARFECYPRLLKTRPASFAYSCKFEDAATGTGIRISFRVSYVEG
jgi:hypothetical protein